MSKRRIAVLVVGLTLLASGLAAEVIECWPVSEPDQKMYNDWGAEQQPPLEWVDCSKKCSKGLRLCRFRERPPSSKKSYRLATCNGRDVGPPCKLAPPVRRRPR